MRKIKFRAWDETHGEMVYSDKEDCFYVNNKGVLFMYAIPKSEGVIGEVKYHRDYNVMQFTGIQDKNGVDIYDGDILGGYIFGAVMWCDKGLTFAFEFAGECSCWRCSGDAQLNDYDKCDLEVVGNIHQNKELLK